MHLEISAPELNQLYVWLRDEDELRGRLSLAGPPPRAGELGSAVDVLLVSLAPGGVAGALVAGLFSWLRTRTSDVKIHLRKADGAEVDLSATAVRGMTAAEMTQAITKLSDELDA
jgi:hypothetical protein